MALILNTDKTYNPKISDVYGLDLTSSDCYGVIDSIEYDKDAKTCLFALTVYANSTARTNSDSAVDRIVFSYNDDEFDTSIGNNGVTISGAYTLAALTLTDWISDE